MDSGQFQRHWPGTETYEALKLILTVILME